MSITVTRTPGKGLLTPRDHVLFMIDFQPQMAFATKFIDSIMLRNNGALIANAAAGFEFPTIPDDGRREELLRPHVLRGDRAVPRAEAARSNVDEHPGGRGGHQQLNTLNKMRRMSSGLWTSVCIVGVIYAKTMFGAHEG